MELETLIPDLGIKYGAVFIPFTQSRSFKKGAEHDSTTWNLNWIVTITRDSAPRAYVRTDYSQGVAHIPGYRLAPRPFQNDYYHACWEAAERGRAAFPKVWSFHGMGYTPGRALPPPKFADVLHCLLLDGQAIEAGSFEDWASDFGYDTDSRRAEDIYRACLEMGRELRSMFTTPERDQLNQLFQDY
jgi:hypothetical protein